MGVNYELRSIRTLSNQGECRTLLSARAVYDLTHSYSILPGLFKNGEFFPKILICFQEMSGKLGPRVVEKLEKFENIEITCTKSGKFTKSIMQYW